MADRNPDLFSYTLKNDNGFSPNTFGGICTLACTNPNIRYNANIGDWIIGTTSSDKGKFLIYAMQVSRTLTFDLYWNDPEYKLKKPNKNNVNGDNIYKYDTNGDLVQVFNEFHGERKFKIDTSVNRVLISKIFYYFGKEAPKIPTQYNSIISAQNRYTRIKATSKNSAAVSEFLVWLRDNYKPGVNGQPAR